MENELWKSIIGYEGIYEISTFGRIKSLARTWTVNKCVFTKSVSFLSFSYTRGYARVVLTKNGKTKTYAVHKLVVETFEGEILPPMQVNHKNGVRGNNRLSNLEVVTPSQNLEHSYRVLGRNGAWKGFKSADMPMAKPVIQLDKFGNEITRYPSAMDAEKDGYLAHAIGMVARGERKTYRKFIWKFA